MKFKLVFLFVLFAFVLVLINGCSEDNPVQSSYVSASPQASTYDSKYVVDWMWLSCKIVADQSFDNPPQAGRIYTYTSIAVYECILSGMPNNRSLRGQIKEYPDIPRADQSLEYDWPSVLTGAMPVMFRGLYRNLYNPSNNMINNLYNRQVSERKLLKDSVIINRSLSYGSLIAGKLLDWANTDGSIEIRGLPYTPPPRTLNPANWEPINPGDTAVEPYWGTLRTFAVPDNSFAEVAPSFPFDTAVGSSFYNDEYEVYQLKTTATEDQKQIAVFWRDKQLTPQPPGHWVSILNQIIKRDDMKLDKSAECFAYLGIAVGDAFITGWHLKYKYNLLRPQSYIRDYIQAGWTPYLPTPAFPDYPSGHSTSSGACSYVLTYLLGEVPFSDTTHLRIGMPTRHFDNFYEAAVECSNSRIYGGIHYRNACENGVLAGQKIGEGIVNRVRLRIF